MNTANPKEMVDPDSFAEQWSDLQYSCRKCEQFAYALAFVWSTIKDMPDGLHRKRGICAAHFLACELDAYADDL
jgi:hypothetical protein